MSYNYQECTLYQNENKLGVHVQRHVRVNFKFTKHFVENVRMKKYNHMHVNKNKIDNLLLQGHAWLHSRFISLTLHDNVSLC